jgi:hypothetical protein
MDFGLTSEQQMLVDSIRAFVEAELKPYEEEVERTNKVRPELIRQYAHHLADLAVEREPTKARPEVHAISMVSLNGRRPQPMIDDQVDLAAEPPTLGTPSWVAPLRLPLPPRDQVWEPE